MVQVYKHLHHYDQASIPLKIMRKERPNQRHDFQLVRNFPNAYYRGVQANSFYYHSIKSWNNLFREVVDTKSIKTFKERGAIGS